MSTAKVMPARSQFATAGGPARPLRTLELFTCSGGMAEGFRRVGIVFSWAFDVDPNACDSYARNLGHRPVQMDVRDLVRMVRGGWSPGPLDLLVADPPCTPWSRAGKRKGTEDERDMLEETTGLIRMLRPTCYLVGNVPGLQDATQWHHVQEHLGGLAREGYCVTDYVQLDAANYGIPQHRIRPFWFGHMVGPCIRWPAPTHGPGGQLAISGCELLPWVTCREALQHLPLEQLGRPVRMRLREAGEDGRKNGGDRTRCSSPDDVARTVVAKADRKGGQILIPHGHPTSWPDEPAPTITTEGGRAGNRATTLIANARHPAATLDGPAGTITTVDGQAAMTWPWNRPAITVCADRRLAPPGHHEDSFLPDNRARGPNAVVLSERAAAILQGFPEGWHFAGKTKSSRWSQLGQAMPPGLAEAVARAVLEQMNWEKK